MFCNSCYRCRDLDFEKLVGIYGRGMELPEIGKRARCGECGGKGASVQVVVVCW